MVDLGVDRRRHRACSWPGSSGPRWPASPRPRCRRPSGRRCAGGAGSGDSVEAADRFADLADQSPPGHGAPARVRLAAPRPGGRSGGPCCCAAGSDAGALPISGCRLRRHGRLHHAQPAAVRGGARRGREPLRGGGPRHRDGRRGPGGQDDRRRGHVRGRHRPSTRPASAWLWPRPTPTTSCSPTCAWPWPSGRCSSRTVTSTGRWSTWPAASVNMAAPGACSCPTSSTPPASRPTATEAAPAEFAFKVLRPRLVKDLGRVQLWAAAPSRHRAPDPRPPGLGRRWERLAEVLHDLDDLRERGERVHRPVACRRRGARRGRRQAG